jgi:hypothetical protein
MDGAPGSFTVSTIQDLTMKKIWLALVMLTCSFNTARSQEQPPQILVDAAHCLAVKNHLPPYGKTALNFGYLIDSKSYSGEKVIYVVEYVGPGRSDGMVFTIFLTDKGGRRVFNIQNNARFIRSNKGPDVLEGVNFVEPPLGGTGTQLGIVSAIKQIERQPKFMISVNGLAVAPANTRCESYADSK